MKEGRKELESSSQAQAASVQGLSELLVAWRAGSWPFPGRKGREGGGEGAAFSSGCPLKLEAMLGEGE